MAFLYTLLGRITTWLALGTGPCGGGYSIYSTPHSVGQQDANCSSRFTPDATRSRRFTPGPFIKASGSGCQAGALPNWGNGRNSSSHSVSSMSTCQVDSR
ncbi:hypothetical protein BJV78DRAFT_1228686 [Lactifluus subvellereus]|nr:hypothetical protein BJV78DRAFT_1228686 [Lactifluus subvellereus]